MKQTQSESVAGVVAPAVRPTPLGAAILAGAAVLPLGVIVGIVQLVFS